MHKTLFIIWKNYQRRADVLAPRLNARNLFIPHRFRRKVFRPSDYLYKILLSSYLGLRNRPELIVVQSPPLYSAITALILRIPYIIDAHNPVFQNVGGKISWGKLPFSRFLIRHALAIIVHNHGILELAKKNYPGVKFYNIPDPIETIRDFEDERFEDRILVICSFDPDEPVEVLLESIARLPEYKFMITADCLKLPHDLQVKLRDLSNVRLTGFLAIDEYHAVLGSCTAALVLTSQDLIQPSGACEALSSNTQLIISNTALIQELFGEWAILVENNAPSIVSAIQGLKLSRLDLRLYRERWNQSVDREIDRLTDFIRSDHSRHRN
jgi:glycosyltransferase involved in cell wall biosynthesis